MGIDITSITMDESGDGVQIHFPGYEIGAVEQWTDDEGGHVDLTLSEVPTPGDADETDLV